MKLPEVAVCCLSAAEWEQGCRIPKQATAPGEAPFEVFSDRGSTPLASTIKDPTFVYHDKSGVLPYFRAKQAENKQNTGKSGPRSGHHDCTEALFSFPAPETGQKSWCTFVRSLLCKDLRVMTRRGDLNHDAVLFCKF